MYISGCALLMYAFNTVFNKMLGVRVVVGGCVHTVTYPSDCLHVLECHTMLQHSCWCCTSTAQYYNNWLHHPQNVRDQRNKIDAERSNTFALEALAVALQQPVRFLLPSAALLLCVRELGRILLQFSPETRTRWGTWAVFVC